MGGYRCRHRLGWLLDVAPLAALVRGALACIGMTMLHARHPASQFGLAVVFELVEGGNGPGLVEPLSVGIFHPIWCQREYAMWAPGERMPSQKPSSIMRCPCGKMFDSHRLEHTLIHVPQITATVDNETYH